MVQFQAVFDAPAGAYRPGDMVAGIVRLRLTHTVSLRGIELVFCGQSSVNWTKEVRSDQNDITRTTMVPYHSEEFYYRINFFAFGDMYAANVLHAGEYNFNFTMQLPLNVPSSFEGEYGFIHHTMTIQSYPTIGNAPYSFHLNVINPLDLNRKPSIMSPLRLMDEKTLCCWCCASGPVSCVVSLPASGFCMGNEIPVTIDIENLTDKIVKGVEISLQRVDIFTAVRPERDIKKEHSKLIFQRLDSMPPKCSNTWQRNVAVPFGPPSGLKYCSIIDTEYFLHVEVELPSPHINLKLKTPITVGTVPLAAAVASPPMLHSLPSDAMNNTFASPPYIPPPPPYSCATAPSAPRTQ